jgi:hypothetical protein
MKSLPRRRKAQIAERLTPCACCSYPLSQRHHLVYSVAQAGDHRNTLQLCANCHELAHIIDQALEDYERNPRKATHARRLFQAACAALGKDDRRIRRMLELVRHARTYREWSYNDPNAEFAWFFEFLVTDDTEAP